MRRILALATLALFAGCANYQWTSRLDAGPKRTVSFTTVENRTYPHRPGLEYPLTQRLKEEISVDRRLTLTDGSADVSLRVSLLRFDEPNVVEDLETGEPAEILLRATARVDATGEQFVGGRVNRRVTVSNSYAPLIGDTREDGLTRLWRDLSREILDIAADYEWTSE